MTLSNALFEGTGIDRIEFTIRELSDIERAERKKDGVEMPPGWYCLYRVYRVDSRAPVTWGMVRIDSVDDDLFDFLVAIARTRPRLVRDEEPEPPPTARL